MKRGTTHTPESRAKMSATRRGMPRSAEHRAAISKALSNRTNTPEGNARRSASMLAYWAARRETKSL